MTADPKRKPHQDEGDNAKRRHRGEAALEEALKNTFPASDPVSVEQPATTGRSVVAESRSSNELGRPPVLANPDADQSASISIRRRNPLVIHDPANV
jgi:single-stranded DNA-specific DHH superfamily exonuclease